MVKFQAVIFDWDGTLADTRQVLVTAFQQVLRESGCQVEDEFIERRIGIGPRLIFREALDTCSISWSPHLLTQLQQRKIQIQITMLDSIQLFEGVVTLLHKLKDQVKIGLATMSNRPVIEHTLVKLGVADYFPAIVTFDDVIHSKPNPEVFLKCATLLDCQAKHCVVIEDSIFGIIAAKEAHMNCIAVTSGMYSREELEKHNPDLIVDAINEYTKILRYII
jgi:HAD superfamily hydrolase (TIGR01509 family)